MKKILALLLSSALILTAAGCDKKEDPANTTEVTNTIVTPVMDDSTAIAVDYLKGQVPLFSAYLETRMSYPLAYEIEVVNENGTAYAGVYIKDEDSMAMYSKDVTGNSGRTIYDGDKLWYIEDATKTSYLKKDYPVESSKEIVASSLLRIDADSASSYTYETGEKELDGTMYKFESITTTDDIVSEYYFDMETGDLKVIVNGTQKTYVTTLENTVKEEPFEIPADYTEEDMQKYLDSLIADANNNE